MNERYTTTAGMRPVTPLSDKPAAAYDPSNPQLGVEVSKTGSLLARANEIADTLLNRMRGPTMQKDCSGGAVGPAGILNDAVANHEAAAALCNRLDELARLLG